MSKYGFVRHLDTGLSEQRQEEVIKLLTYRFTEVPEILNDFGRTMFDEHELAAVKIVLGTNPTYKFLKGC